MIKLSQISQEYLLLFNAITDTEKALDELKQRLILIQQQAEELYISRDA